MLRCHILLKFVWNTDKSPHARKNFQILLVFIFSTYHYFSPYRYKLDLGDPVRQNQQQIRLDIHTCRSQRCYCKQDWLHKHLRTGTHQHLNISKHHKLTNRPPLTDNANIFMCQGKTIILQTSSQNKDYNPHITHCACFTKNK